MIRQAHKDSLSTLEWIREEIRKHGFMSGMEATPKIIAHQTEFKEKITPAVICDWIPCEDIRRVEYRNRSTEAFFVKDLFYYNPGE